jgi:hypothetical protein
MSVSSSPRSLVLTSATYPGGLELGSEKKIRFIPSIQTKDSSFENAIGRANTPSTIPSFENIHGERSLPLCDAVLARLVALTVLGDIKKKNMRLHRWCTEALRAHLIAFDHFSSSR